MDHPTMTCSRPNPRPSDPDPADTGREAPGRDLNTLMAAAETARDELGKAVTIAHEIRTLSEHCQEHVTETPVRDAAEAERAGLIRHVNRTVAIQAGIGALIDSFLRHADTADSAFGGLV